MSPAEDAFDALFAVLEEERAAIRRLDAEGVAKAAAAKEALAAKLKTMTLEELKPVAGSMGLLRMELQRNGILLAHARSCLQGAVDSLAPPAPDGARRGLVRTRV